MNKIMKKLLPPIIVEWINRLRPDYGWKGSYKSWMDAKISSGGYDAGNIFEQVFKATIAVKNGEAEYERDGVLFDKIEYSWPLLVAIFMAYSFRDDKRLGVVDFGGGLGSSYYQNRKFLRYIENLQWSIIEQDGFVDIGRQEFCDDRLKFYNDISQCLTLQEPDILILSSVIQYLEDPYDVLAGLLKHDFKIVVVDRTIVRRDIDDKICVQKVPSSIYKASYPCRIMSEPKLIDFFDKNGYELIESFESLGWRTKSFEFNGYIFGLK